MLFIPLPVVSSMERAARLILLALVGAGLLAGCLGKGQDAVEAAEAEGAQGNVTLPEGRGPILAFEETNRTEQGAGGIEHHHDYWEGRTRVLLLEKSAAFGIVTPGSRSWDEVRPDPEALVYEGTATIDVTLTKPMRASLDDPLPATPPTLFYRHAAAADWIQVGAATWDTPLPIKVTDPAQTDMPHATYSLWQFRVETTDPMMSDVTFGFKAEIVRGEGEIPLWPGHPDFYAETQQRRVADADARTAQNGLAGDVSPVEAVDGTVAPEKVVSYGTRTLYVFLNISTFEVTNPLDQPTNFFLWFHNASGTWNTTNIFDAEKYPATKMEHLFVLKVADAGMDSPYAAASRWGFELGAAFMQGVPGGPRVSCYSGCATWSSEYHVTIIATPEVLADDAYDANA